MTMDRQGSSLPADGADARAALLAQLLADEGLDDGALGSIPRRTVGGPAPLSFAQEVLWLVDRASPGMTAYNTPVARRIRGRLDLPALQQALDALVARHEALRTIFTQEADHGVQRVLPPGTVPLRLLDFRSEIPEGREAAALAALRTVADTPFDLTSAPGFRAALARISDDDAILLLLTHHIVSDAWSYRLIFRDLGTLYDAGLSGHAAALPDAGLRPSDYAVWEREQATGEAMTRGLTYWRDRMADAPVLTIPSTHVGRIAQSHSGARRELVLSRDDLEKIRTFGRERGVTLYMILLAAYQATLHRYTGQLDIVTGSAVVGRTRRELEEVVGYFSQALPMRTSFAGEPGFASLLERVAETVLGAFEHQDVSLEALTLDLQRARPGAEPLFRAVLTMQDALSTDLALQGTTITPVELEASATKFDLTMLVSERPSGLELSLWYRTELFDASMIDRFLGHLRSLLLHAIASPETPVARLPLLSAPEEVTIAGFEGRPGNAEGAPLLPALILSHARHVPDAVAVVSGGREYSYRELALRASELAGRLRDLGVTEGDRVGLLMERSIEARISSLAIWMTGSAYVPLMPDLPDARLAHQVAESGVKAVVTLEPHRHRLSGDLSAILLDLAEPLPPDARIAEGHPVSSDALAYVLFTSGSTGVPKGVAVTHGNVANYVQAVRERLGLDTPERDGEVLHCATVSTLGADLGQTATLTALACGGVLHILGPEIATEPARFADYMRSHRVDLLKLTPSHLQALIGSRSGDDLAAMLPGRWLVLGGEALPWGLVDRVLQVKRCQVINHYGPTETTIGAVTFAVTAEAAAQSRRDGALTAPIGRPLTGVAVHVVDRHGQRLPVGVPGELWIAGAGVAQGYLQRPELTTERFVADPFVHDDGRCYRTGDRVRWLESGVLEFLGRNDDQVKVRGYRVELGEIEQQLRSHAMVGAASVQLWTPPGPDAEPIVVAWVAPRPASGYAMAHAERLSAEGLTRHLNERLPAYMIPGRFLLVDDIPLTSNGKVDRAALPAPDASAEAPRGSIAPRTETERKLAAIWGEVFRRDGLGVTDHFLQLGGHSLLAIRILGKLTRTFGVRLPLRALFDAPTIEALARLVDDAVRAAPVTGG